MFDKYRITYSDGTANEVTGKKSDVVRFERKYKMPVANMLADNAIYTEHLWFFGWCAEQRAGNTELSFDDWVETIESVEVLTVEEENPTAPNPSPTP
jgi:hypothetical protein